MSFDKNGLFSTEKKCCSTLFLSHAPLFFYVRGNTARGYAEICHSLFWFWLVLVNMEEKQSEEIKYHLYNLSLKDYEVAQMSNAKSKWCPFWSADPGGKRFGTSEFIFCSLPLMQIQLLHSNLWLQFKVGRKLHLPQVCSVVTRDATLPAPASLWPPKLLPCHNGGIIEFSEMDLLTPRIGKVSSSFYVWLLFKNSCHVSEWGFV